MTDGQMHTKGKLADIFASINMSEIPAMSVHVQELLALSSSKRSANYENLAKIILKDFSLTHKVLQFANSAYYGLGRKVSTVSMAVTVLGFNTVRDLALGIALVDDFVQAGVNTEEISDLLGLSFLAALLARNIAETRYLRVLPEEAFICSLMRNLGKIISCIYLPALYNAIKNEIKKGSSEDEATRTFLDGLTYSGVGREVAIFWNMTESVIRCMEEDPEIPTDDYNVEKYLHCIADFSNRYVESLWFQYDINPLMDKYGASLSLDEEETIKMLIGAQEASATIFDSIRPKILDFDFRKRLEEICPGTLCQQDTGIIKTMEDYWLEMNKLVEGNFRLNVFFSLLLDSLCFGIGVDRAIFAMLHGCEDGTRLIAKLGRGDVVPGQLKKFNFDFSQSVTGLLQKSLSMCKDIAVSPDKVDTLPAELRFLAYNRIVYLFPVSLNAKGIGLLYLDHTEDKPRLDSEQIKLVRKFRDFAQVTIDIKRKNNRA